MSDARGTARALAAALRSPFVPEVVVCLEETGYLDLVWPQLSPSMETAGFLGSGLYMADMALDAVEEVYEPVLNRDSLRAAGVTAAELTEIAAVLDVFHWVQPQLLLVVSALAEAWDEPRVGGQGRLDPRETSERETVHLATSVRLAPPDAGLLPAIAEVLQTAEAPELFRAMAMWPTYLATAWDELQHLAAYPLFRRRGRALYFYARSSSRFLATPLEASAAALAARGMSAASLVATRAALDAAQSTLAMMMMHCCALRLGLGIATREVVQQPSG